MEDKLLEILDDLNIKDTELLLDKNIDFSVDLATRKRIEKLVMKKAGYYKEKSINKNKINNIIGGIVMKKKIALALSAAVVLSLAGGGYAYAKTPVAYVSMDINPSVELGVNAFDTVVSVEAYNEDGKNILEGTDLVNVKVDAAVSTVISNAISDGYINEDGSSVIEITTSTDKTTGAAVELDESLKNAVDETLSNNDIQAEVETENVALARRDEARKLGITPGKLNLIQKLQALDPTITVENYKNSSVKEIQKKTKELRKNRSLEITSEDGTSTTTTTNTSDGTITNDTSDKTTVNVNTVTSTETADDSDKAAIVKIEKNNNSSNNKVNNGNSKKEENINVNQEQKTSETVIEKQNNSNNSNSQSINNSSKEDKKSNDNSSSKSENNSNSNSNSSKSDNSGSSNSNSQGKGKNK